METFGTRLKRARLAAKKTQEEIGHLFRDRKTGEPMSRNAVANWESGVNFPETDKLPALALALGVSIDFLLIGSQKGNVSSGPAMRGQVPIISWVQAGAFAAAVDNFDPGVADEWAPTTLPIHKHTFALRVRGDSMTNPTGLEPNFPDGQIIIVEPDAVSSPDKLVGSMVIVRRDAEDEATFKQLVKDGGKFYLKPLNPHYPLLELRDDDHICGVVREKSVRYF